MKIFKNSILSITFMILISLSASYADNGIYVNNQKISKSTPIIIQNDKSFISSYDLAVALGASSTWDDKTKTATITTDKVKFEFTNASDMIKINGSKVKIELKPFIKDGKLMIPTTVIRDYYNKKISWNHKTKNFLINSNATALKDKPVFSAKNTMPLIQKTMGEDYNLFNLTHVLTDEIVNEKFLPNGTYHIFKANERGNITKTVNGYFYMNIYTDEVYYYPLDTEDISSNMKKYSGGNSVEKINFNGKNNTHSLIATTKMMNSIKQSDNSLSGFSYNKKDKITKDYLTHLPEANYYYYQASKKENNEVKPQFEIAQNSNTLEAYLFLKKENGINIVKLPEYQLIKTINLKK